ncbi:MAG: ATP-binding protein [Vicinamibacterales bacterium]
MTSVAFAESRIGSAPIVPPPAPPNSIEETGLHPDTLAQLLLKTLIAGEANGTGLADRLRVPYSVLDALIQHARVEKLVEVRGTSGAGSAGFRYILTDLGRDRAGQFVDICRYIGPAPVPLAQYNAYVRAGMEARPYLDRTSLAAGFEHLVVNNEMLDQLGPAVNSGKALFLYGAPGNGKTVFAEGIGRAFGGEMHMPFAVDVDGQVITMYDPVSHQRMTETPNSHSVITTAAHDRRWESIRRPVVVVGGELTLEMLDLTFNPISKFYEAPIQLKANGGVFVVDDFGRQRIPPRDLLNRWIVPLESRVDFLTLHTGRKFEVPFNVLIVFATNLKPQSLADEAFLRRIPYKILAKNPTFDEYCRIFELNCKRRGLTFDPVMVEYLERKYYRPRKLQMRACHPRDLISQVVDMCRYTNREPVITRELLDAACGNYFIEEAESQGSGN